MRLLSRLLSWFQKLQTNLDANSFLVRVLSLSLNLRVVLPLHLLKRASQLYLDTEVCRHILVIDTFISKKSWKTLFRTGGSISCSDMIGRCHLKCHFIPSNYNTNRKSILVSSASWMKSPFSVSWGGEISDFPNQGTAVLYLCDSVDQTYFCKHRTKM